LDSLGEGFVITGLVHSARGFQPLDVVPDYVVLPLR
jgi:hypothetical protein